MIRYIKEVIQHLVDMDQERIFLTRGMTVWGVDAVLKNDCTQKVIH